MAVFNSWENDRANAYRKLNNIPASWGTAGQCAGHGLRNKR